jgi:hypothetical protein
LYFANDLSAEQNGTAEMFFQLNASLTGPAITAFERSGTGDHPTRYWRYFSGWRIASQSRASLEFGLNSTELRRVAVYGVV